MNKSVFNEQDQPHTTPHTQNGDIALSFKDRFVPSSIRIMSCTLIGAEALCVLAILGLTYFFQSRVIADGLHGHSAALALIGLLPCGGLLVVEYFQMRLTVGREYARESYRHWTSAMIGFLCFASLTFVHPLIGLPILMSCGVLGLATWALANRQSIPRWNFTKEESVAFFSGRDEHGFRLVQEGLEKEELSRVLVIAATSFAFLLSLSVSSWLAATGILNVNAAVLVALLCSWSTFVSSRCINFAAQSWYEFPKVQSNVAELVPQNEDGDVINAGLQVSQLSVVTLNGSRLLSDISLEIDPGTVVGVIGDTGSGKTLLQNVLTDPFARQDLRVSGSVTLNRNRLWDRSGSDQTGVVARVDQVPKMLPISGVDNLTCLQSETSSERGKKILEQLVFSADDAQQILDASDATVLSSSFQKALGLARSFVIAPALYLFDRPEDGLTEKMIGALAGRIKTEARLGRCFLMATDNRALLEVCDNLMVMHQGCVVDFGPAKDIRSRLSAGWARFVGPRALETEENFENWIRSHFKRDGDEQNRRKLCTTASELLALSCQTQNGFENEMVSFEFKHFEGHCLLKMRDRDLQISSGALTLAREEQMDTTKKPTPLGNVLKVAQDFEQSVEGENRALTVKIQTYDPRKQKTSVKQTNAA